MAMKHWTKFQVSTISGLEFLHLPRTRPLRSFITRRKIIWSSRADNMHISNGNETLYKVSSLYTISDLGEVSTSVFTPAIPLGSSITRRKTIWSSRADTMHKDLQRPMQHCTKFQVSTISGLGGEVSTRFCDRQVGWQKAQTPSIRHADSM
jgi:hypothetical protein